MSVTTGAIRTREHRRIIFVGKHLLPMTLPMKDRKLIGNTRHCRHPRSVEQNKLRYVTMISDGDCKNHASVVELKPYGDIAIEKEDCVGHVQKRMGRRLRDLKNTYKGRKLGGERPFG